MSEWKPGDVAMVKAHVGHHETRVVRGFDEKWHGEDGIYRIVTDARPLVVIDPEDREQVERLSSLVEANYGPRFGDRGVNSLAAGLREFANPTPPKPEVYEHLVYQRRGKTSEAVCGKTWISNPDVTVVGRCPECSTVNKNGWQS